MKYLTVVIILSTLCFGQKLSTLSNVQLADKADIIATNIDIHSELNWIHHVDAVEYNIQKAHSNKLDVAAKKEVTTKVSADKVSFEGEKTQLSIQGNLVRNEMLRRLRRIKNDDDKRLELGLLAARLATLAIEIRRLP